MSPCLRPLTAPLPGAYCGGVSRYEQPRKRRGFLSVLGRIFFFLVLAVISLFAGIGGGYWLEGEQTVDDINERSLKDPQVRKAAKKLGAAVPGRPAIAIVVGQDFRRWAKDEERGGLADTVMLLRADPNVGTLSTLSFPRDLSVPIHCPEPVSEVSEPANRVSPKSLR